MGVILLLKMVELPSKSSSCGIVKNTSKVYGKYKTNLKLRYENRFIASQNIPLYYLLLHLMKHICNTFSTLSNVPPKQVIYALKPQLMKRLATYVI